MILSNIKTPGVYIDEVSLLPPSVAGVETGIPAFVGYTQKAITSRGRDLSNVPYRISSLLDYVENFGKGESENDLALEITDYVDSANNTLKTKIDAGWRKAAGPVTAGKPNHHNMYYSMELYFANGGGPCYIVSVGQYLAGNLPILKADLLNGVKLLENEDEPTMIVVPEAINLSTDADRYDIYNEALMQAAKLKDRVVIMDVKQVNLKIEDDIKDFRGQLMPDNLRFGAAYYPYLDTTIDYDYAGKEMDIKIAHKRVLADGTPAAQPLGKFDGAALNVLNIPEIPVGTPNPLSDNQLYNLLKDKLNAIPVTLPPSPAMAGVYARVDAERGVWKAPANVGVASIIGPSRKIADADQNGMNVDPTYGQSVNAIRTITGRGTVVWGARTLDGNSNEWRYIPVRRYFNFVEESVKKATYRFVFEPNDANTWVKVRGMIENFLTNQWREGALQGAKPEDAFFVRIGLGQTMTKDDVLNGFLIVDIGMAVVRPAEFIVLRFMHKMAEG